MNPQLNTLADELDHELEQVGHELDEIGMLLTQATTEAERHEQRRVQAEERVAAVEADTSAAGDAVIEARAQLLSQTRRATLMQSQLDVLSGKQRSLGRYRDRLAATLPIVRDAAGVTPSALLGTGGNGADSRDVLAAQEQMRREIARQMHDGPAQSIANIALQAQIVQHLFERDPDSAAKELEQLVGMVQRALEATKSFIFEVRPMVLDDLGLVPTLRRSAAERTRRSGINVRFESVGADRRLSTEIESGLFRIVDDAVTAYLGVGATSVMVRLDWSEGALRARVSGAAPGGERTDEERGRAAVAAARRDRTLPQALATMIHEQETDEAARHAGLPEALQAEIEQRAAALRLRVSLSEDRWQLEVVAAR
jgi:two-component system sensor histidine kinase DegS